MPSTPLPLRIEKELHETLQEGARRTPHKKQELIRITLRRHLRSVIEEEATRSGEKRLTNIAPWPKRVLEKAYKTVGSEWDHLEGKAIRAQGKPDFKD
jgi:hypothetical protein